LTFSSRTKNDLARVIPRNRCCQLAELIALVRLDGIIILDQNKRITLHLHMENAAVARKAVKLLKVLFNLPLSVSVQRKKRLKKNNVYLIRVPAGDSYQEFYNMMGIRMLNNKVVIDWPAVSQNNGCCSRAYLRGAFLGGGSISDPGGTYHLELITKDHTHAQVIYSMMQKLGLEPKLGRRKNWFVIYLKDSDQIVSFLSLVGAHRALLDFENTRIMKDMRNQVNRLVNCETANLNKTVNAGVRQEENIRFLISKIGYEKLPLKLREVARLRLEYPEASLRELGELLSPPLTKSAVNHRLRRLEKMAEELR
jgi:DNA-binding protein WhiA